MSETQLKSGDVAVITGAASGIGLAVARALAGRGMKVCMVDASSDLLSAAATTVARSFAIAVDVTDASAVEDLAGVVASRLGPVSLLMNNAGIAAGGDAFADMAAWRRIIDVNLMGVLHGLQAFVPAMAASGRPGVVINTGSKQGITQPPGNTAYNVSKSGVKSLTEGLAHTLRCTPGCNVSAHLLIPGLVYTGMTAPYFSEQPASAWGPEQVAERLLEGIEAGDFYILCPDNETPREIDEKRIMWSALDLIENRPALSRWHPQWKEAYERFIAETVIRR